MRSWGEEWMAHAVRTLVVFRVGEGLAPPTNYPFNTIPMRSKSISP